ncbi:MAG: hypothetical protein CL808_02090 [Citromicrobium sp.]|nr:hypothetical protein [Citromicrobium sp.]
MIADLPRPIAVVAHDAGAANMLFAWLEDIPAGDLRVALAGPAERIWQAQFRESPVLASIDDALDGAASLVSGTGWASDMEHAARVEAARRGIPSLAVVDHWVNYAPRFEREGTRQLPDAILVGDAEAVTIARETFPGTRIAQLPNLYLQRQARDAGPVPDDGDILFVMEPARSTWGHGTTPGEFQALDYFMAHRGGAGIGEDVAMRLRPHPSDAPGKYDDWIRAQPGATLDTAGDMSEALGKARWVAGLNSFALVIALEAGRKAISCLPPWAPACVLPQAGIVRL